MSFMLSHKAQLVQQDSEWEELQISLQFPLLANTEAAGACQPLVRTGVPRL